MFSVYYLAGFSFGIGFDRPLSNGLAFSCRLTHANDSYIRVGVGFNRKKLEFCVLQDGRLHPVVSPLLLFV